MKYKLFTLSLLAGFALAHQASAQNVQNFAQTLLQYASSDLKDAGQLAQQARQDENQGTLGYDYLSGLDTEYNAELKAAAAIEAQAVAVYGPVQTNDYTKAYSEAVVDAYGVFPPSPQNAPPDSVTTEQAVQQTLQTYAGNLGNEAKNLLQQFQQTYQQFGQLQITPAEYSAFKATYNDTVTELNSEINGLKKLETLPLGAAVAAQINKQLAQTYAQLAALNQEASQTPGFQPVSSPG